MAVNDPSLADVEFGPAAGSTLSDAELIASTRAGDADAFAVLYERHVDAARACARRLTRSRADADDLVAEAFAKVLSALRRGKGPDLAFRPYLLTSVRNALYDRTRRDSRVEFTDEPPESVNATLLSADYAREDQAMVAQAYASLPERWQMVLWHTDVEGRPPAEIAPLLGISANSVAALAYRAREGLRQAYLSAHVNKGISDGCKGTADKLSAFVRDGLSARDRRGVEEHLAGCTACTALLAELEEANKSLKIVLVPLLAGIPAAAYLSGMSTGGITKLVRRHPAPVAAAAVAAAAAVVFAGVALRAPGSDDAADALTVPPIGSGRPTTTTTTTTTPTTLPPSAPVTVAPSAATSPITTLFTVPAFDTAIPPNTAVPFNPNATTATTVRRTTTTVRSTTTTTRPAATTTTTTTTEGAGATATTTTSTTTTTTPVTQAPVDPPAITSSVEGIGPVYSGQAAYFRVRVNNAASGALGSARMVGVGAADGVVVEFNLPVGTSFLGPVSGDWQCEPAGSTVRCLLPRVESGATKEAIFSIDVSAGAGTNLTISPVVMVNGQRTDAPTVSRTVADGSAIADFSILPGADLVVAGNSAFTCDPLDIGADPDCGTGVKTFAKPAGSAALNDTSAELALAGRPVASAYLVWQGSGTTTDVGSVTLTPPGGPSTVISTPMVRVSGNSYVAVADVTAIVQASGSGSYAVSGVPAVAAQDNYGGWALMANVFDLAGPLRAVTLSVPLTQITAQTQPIPFPGLPQTPAPRRVTVGVLTGEGDLGIVRDEGLGIIDPAATATGGVVPLASALHPADGNFFRSAIPGPRVPDTADTFGTDLDVFTASISGSLDTAAIKATTGNDVVWLSAIAVLFDL